MQAPSAGVSFRRRLGVPSDAFVSLYMFDVHSTLTRKNPQAAVAAFLRFARHNRHAHLILKVNRLRNASPEALRWLPRHPRIHLIGEPLSPGELTDLYRSADCYLSLHRSEGFGRTLVEALQHGLDLICTDFSGPRDFVNQDNALLVRWDRRDVAPGDYPHAERSWWAEPSVDHAAERLTQAFEKRRRGLTNTSGQVTGAAFTPQAMAQRYRPILQAVQSQLIAQPPLPHSSRTVVRT
jgi:glycosyltransferase involved in cell wall biosynthesis